MGKGTMVRTVEHGYGLVSIPSGPAVLDHLLPIPVRRPLRLLAQARYEARDVHGDSEATHAAHRSPARDEHSTGICPASFSAAGRR